MAHTALVKFAFVALSFAASTAQAARIPGHSPNTSSDSLVRQAGLGKRALGKAWSGASYLSAAGTTGVSAMQLSVVDDDHVLIYDKAEENPLQINGHPAWGSVYTISTQAVRPLNMKTNSFCAGGGWTSDGTLVSFGGQQDDGDTNYVGDGFMSIRKFVPCNDDDNCDVVDDIKANSLTSKRWYPSTARLGDGSLIVVGGSTEQSFTGGRAIENPTLEFYPRKGNGKQIFSQFISDANPTNLFPIMFYLPNGLLFVAANKLAMLYDWKTNKETRLPSMPNGVRINYPATAAAVLLPLTIANNWTPEILICGGTTANVDGPPEKLSALTPASTQCVRMVMDAAGIKGGWQVEQMDTPRIMGEALLTPDGKVLIVNGAKSGVAGFSDADPSTRLGEGNARNPNYKATLYDPLAAKGKRFSSNFPSSKIERMYHSSATLLPDGTFMITGSNPNPETDTESPYPSRWDVEILSPPYMTLDRPAIDPDTTPDNYVYGKDYQVDVYVPDGAKVITTVLIDLGYSTHAVHMNHRLVELKCKLTANRGSVIMTAPANTGIYPPGYAWLYVLADGIPSAGFRVMIGSGKG